MRTLPRTHRSGALLLSAAAKWAMRRESSRAATRLTVERAPARVVVHGARGVLGWFAAHGDRVGEFVAAPRN